MKHHIIVKYNALVTDKQAMQAEIEQFFAPAGEIEGVHRVSFYPNCIPVENRFDLMIVLEMDKEALPNWNTSKLHLQWKEQYGRYILSKAIFDCE
ncbi:MAG: hypothetical protein IJO67_10350 [Clostridia bacterium]|nr:hypothetical protein [Clostridia bacterium]MBR6753347.1 hypothetical protein [Clostridia bacterium]